VASVLSGTVGLGFRDLVFELKTFQMLEIPSIAVPVTCRR